MASKGHDKDVIARALGRASADYLLRSVELLRKATTGGMVDSLICLAVARGNLDHYRGDETFDREFGSIQAIPPDDIRRPVTIRGLAEFLDLPYETVRRNVLRLTTEGLLEKHRRGYTVPAKIIAREQWTEILRTNLVNVERLLRTYQRLSENLTLETSA
jgi:hypothetical protein